MACASVGLGDMNQPGSSSGGDDEPVAKRRCIVHAGIPDDIVEQILLRLPVKSILRFRSVCKSWHTMVADPSFARRLQLHHHTAPAPSMLVLPCWSRPEIKRMGSISFFRYPGHGAVAKLAHERPWSSGVAADWDLPLHCNGLVLVFSAVISSQIFVCNPATEELALLPACATRDCLGEQSVGFGADPSTGKAKVVRCFTRYSDVTWTNYSVGCEVFSLGDTAWRPVADSPYIVTTVSAPCVCGAIYWIAALPSPTTGSCTAFAGTLRFDLRDEEFAGFPRPPCMRLMGDVEARGGTLTELGDKLCYSQLLAGCHTVQLWTASTDDDDESRWSWHCTVVLSRPARSVVPFANDYQGSIFFNVDSAVICRYDPKRRVVERVVDMKQQMNYYFRSSDKLYRYSYHGSEWIHHAIPYEESLVSIKVN